MKLVLVIASLDAGGAERALANLANALCTHHDINILRFSKNPSFYPLNPSIKESFLPELKYDNIYKKIINRYKKLRDLRKMLKSLNADFIISFLDTTNISCVLASLFLNKRLILCEHSSQNYLSSPLFRTLRRLTYKKANALCVLHEKDKKYYDNFVKKVVVMPNICSFATLKPKAFIKEKLVIFIGRLDENKNAKMFIKAMSLTPYKGLVVGQGSLENELKKQAFNNPNISFLHECKDIKAIYEKASVLCLCSHTEGLPSVLIEAIYFDTARISTPYLTGFDELLKPGFDSLIANNASELVKGISKLLEDEDLRLRLCKNARLRAGEFTPAKVILRWEQLFKEL